MIEFETNFELPLKIPSGWHEVTIAQYLRFKNEYNGNYFNLISIFTGWSEEDLRKIDPSSEVIINQAISWITEPAIDFENLKLPEWLVIPGIKDPETLGVGDFCYKVPEDLGYSTLAQKVSLDQKIMEATKENKDLVELVPLAVSIYMEPIVSGKDFNMDRAEEFIPYAMNCAMVDIYPIGSFFLRNSIDLMISGRKQARKVRRQLKKGRGRIKFHKK